MPTVNRRRLITVAASFGLTFPVALGIAGAVARRTETPRIIALGAGDDLSILVTAGPARLLLATGTDTTAFGNAFGAALPLGLRRIDVVLLAGRGKSTAVADYALHAVAGRTYAVIDHGLAVDELGNDAVRRPEMLTANRRYQLPEDVAVSVETAGDGEDDDAQSVWRVMIECRLSRVVVVPDGWTLDRFPPPDSFSALIITGSHPTPAVASMPAPVLVVGAESVPHDVLREEVVPALQRDLYLLSVFPGEATRLDFVEDGLRIPGNARLIAALASSGDK